MFIRLPIRWLRDLPTALQQKQAFAPIAISYTYLFILIFAEVITTFVNSLVGLVLFSALLIGLMVHASKMSKHPIHDLLLSLALIPLLRLLSLSLPLHNFEEQYWQLIVAIPLLIAAFMTLGNMVRSRREVGLNLNLHFIRFPVQIFIVLLGFPLGYIDYTILKPDALIEWVTWQEIVVPSLILLIGTGFVEEFIFRGLIQHSAVGVMGKWGIVYVSILFAGFHIGFESAPHLALIFFIGLIFGWLVLKTKSILGVTFAHGLINIVILLLLPHSNGEISLDAFIQ
jgi:hypothetical protein